MSIAQCEREISETMPLADKEGDLIEQRLSALKPPSQMSYTEIRRVIEELQFHYASITQLHHQIDSRLSDWATAIDVASQATRQMLELEFEAYNVSKEPMNTLERIELLCCQIDQARIPYQTELESYNPDQATKKMPIKSPERTRRNRRTPTPAITCHTTPITPPPAATTISGPDAPHQPMTYNSPPQENHLLPNDWPFPQPSRIYKNQQSQVKPQEGQPSFNIQQCLPQPQPVLQLDQAPQRPPSINHESTQGYRPSQASQPPASNNFRPNPSSGMYQAHNQAPPPITHNYTQGQPQASQSPADDTASNRMRPHDPANHHHKNTSPTSHSSGPSPSRHFNHQSPVINDYIYASFTTEREDNVDPSLLPTKKDIIHQDTTKFPSQHYKLRNSNIDDVTPTARPKGFSPETTPQAEVTAVATRNPDISKPDRGSPNSASPLESTPIDPVSNRTLSLQKTVAPNINPEPPPSSPLTTAERSMQELSPTSAEAPGSPSSDKQTSQPKPTSKPLSDETPTEDRSPDESDEAYVEAYAEDRTPDEAISQSLHHHPKTKTTEDATLSPSDPTAADDKTDLDNPITMQLYLDKPSPNNRNSDNSSDGASKRAPTNPLGLGAPRSSHPSQPRPKLLARGGRLCDGTTTITTKTTTATTTTTPRRAGECRHSDLKSQSYSRGPAGAAGPPWEPPLYEDANARHGL
ncbi:unnamed protein product, partial [Mesorhabditis spiculigera]